MHSGHVLVVVPDDDLLRSLTFALAAYGYTVTSEREWPSGSGIAAFDCVVLHENALRDVPRDISRTKPPMLLLAYSEGAQASRAFPATVAMPLKGEAVIQAVSAAMASSRITAK